MASDESVRMGGGAQARRPRGAGDRSRSWRSLARLSDRYATLVGFVLMVALFWALEPSTFGTWDNARSILDQTAPIIVLAVGLTIVLAAGEFDLSFPGIIGLASVGAIKTMADGGQSAGVAVLTGLAIGVAAGALAGALVASRRASSFIVTLALSTILTGVALGITEGKVITEVTTGYLDLTYAQVLGVPQGAVIALAAAAVAFALLRWTVFGRNAQALGSNAGAARLAGVRVGFTMITAFAVLGLYVGLAAVLFSSAAGQYSPSIGAGLLIAPYVAAFFGTSVLGAGRFNVFGTVVGALFIGTMQTGMVILGAAPWVSDVVIGAALIVILVAASQRRQP